MDEMDQNTLRKLQMTELEMLAELDRICRKNAIPYILDGGTMLGAVRHGGFIPWDDDVDVRMLRKNYDRFCEICRKELDSKYFLQTYRTDSGYRWGYARILKNGTVFKRKGQHKMTARNGVFIDIFPDDNLPAAFWGKKMCNGISWLCRKLLYSEVGALNKNKFSSWIGFNFLNMFPKYWGHKGVEYLTEKYADCNTPHVRCLSWGAGFESKGFLKKWHTETKEYTFEGLKVPGPIDMEGYLTHIFGTDYMKLPPEEKRYPGHVADYIDFGEEV
ncbi:MAG: LicD family protein [Lachnospiraceae bacterium]|nr:LicD family protein [Lachnospiraceae bacterium]